MLADQCCSARACEIKYLIRYLISQARDYRRRQFERMPILIAAYALSARPCIVSKCFWPAAMLLATSMSVLNIFSILGIWIKVGLSLNSGCKSSGALSGTTRNRRGPIIHMRKLMRAPVAQALLKRSPATFAPVGGPVASGMRTSLNIESCPYRLYTSKPTHCAPCSFVLSFSSPLCRPRCYLLLLIASPPCLNV